MTGGLLSKNYQLQMRQILSAMKMALLQRDPAREIVIVPTMKETLISVEKLWDVGYISVFDDKVANIYDGKSSKIVVSEKEILRRWRNPATGLYWVPLKLVVENVNTDTVTG